MDGWERFVYVAASTEERLSKKIEDRPYWPEIVALKDDLSLRQLADRYGVSSAAVNNAFKRSGIERKPAKPGRKLKKDLDAAKAAVQAVAELPPEPGDGSKTKGAKRYVRPDKTATAAAAAPPAKAKKSRKKKGRGGAPSKAPMIEPFKDQLGTRSDGEIAELAGVNARTVAKYRKSLGIPAYRGHQEKFSASRKAASVAAAGRPKKARSTRKRGSTRRRRSSKIDPYIDRLGTVPDREIAELAGISAEAVRVFRSRHGIPSLRDRRRAEREGAPLPPPAIQGRKSTVARASSKPAAKRLIGMRAWKASLKGGDAVIVVARDLVAAATLLGPEREVQSLEALGRAIV